MDGARALYMMRINQHGVNKGEGYVARRAEREAGKMGLAEGLAEGLAKGRRRRVLDALRPSLRAITPQPGNRDVLTSPLAIT